MNSDNAVGNDLEYSPELDERKNNSQYNVKNYNNISQQYPVDIKQRSDLSNSTE